MRFRQAHKSTTYAVTLSSYGAVVFSGLLHPLLVLLSAIGIWASWFWEPPRVRYERWELPWTIVAVLVFAYQILSVLAGAEVLIAGGHFLLFLLLVKLFNRKESKDYLQIYVLSFLMLTAGTVLNAELTYGIFFLAYVVSSTWALTILHLRRELESNFLMRHQGANQSQNSRIERVMNSERIVGRKFFVGTGLVSLCVFVSAVSLFLLFPRIGFGLFFDQGRGGVSMAGFSDGVQLGGHGVIKKDATVVMRAKVDKAYQGRGAPALHWRGVAFDLYSKGEWRRSRQAPLTARRMNVHAQRTTHHLLYDQGRTTDSILQERLAPALRQDIYLDPVGYDVLFGASMPLAFEFAKTLKSSTSLGRNDELRHPHSAGIKYTVYSAPEPPSETELRAAPASLPAPYQLYLQLPDEIPECQSPQQPQGLEQLDPQCRVRDLARWITRNAGSNYDKALAIQNWLRSELSYTLQMEAPGQVEPVEFFLFSRQQGHCEYFSSAMAILARSVGVPTRNVNGFLGGEWNEFDDFIAVRAGDAHSWVEVYFAGQGWVTFDPTPGGEADLLGRGSSSVLDRMRRIADTLRFKWFKWVIEYDFYQQVKLFKGIGSALKGGANKYFQEPLGQAKDWAKRHKKQAAGFVLLLALAAILYALLRRQRGSSATGGRKAKRTRNPVAIHYLSTCRLLARQGLRRADATTPREFAKKLTEAQLPGARAFHELTEAYYLAEYGAVASPVQEALAKECASHVKTALRESKHKRRNTTAI